MNLAPMRYKDYVWPHNPETYTISFKRQVAVAKVPFCLLYTSPSPRDA